MNLIASGKHIRHKTRIHPISPGRYRPVVAGGTFPQVDGERFPVRLAITRAHEEAAAAAGVDSSDDLGAVRSSRPCHTERPLSCRRGPPDRVSTDAAMAK
ncbi:hypothetical protein GCM10010126_12610 [Planomonospora parontospora]|uniref:Uncharacterized protein n=1 Tax=Planomonospora parontospora TaxID=58119 RepID=A0AA37BDM8_9ACTN|nr:hypothetical protein GCM10010126_12610 [Planomonospora parontospora]